MKNKLVIITANPFPFGNVASVRYSSYALALVGLGVQVEVRILGEMTATNTLSEVSTGEWRGISYRYSPYFRDWRSTRRIQKPLRFLAALYHELCYIRAERPNSVILYTHDLLSLLCFGLWSRATGMRLVLDRSEFPSRRKPSLSARNPTRSWLTYRVYLLLHKLPSAFIVMTDSLSDYYSRIGRKAAGIFKLPMTIDQSQYSHHSASSPYAFRYVACTFGSHGRDCIEDSVRAFMLLLERWPDCPHRLLLAGPVDLLPERLEVQKLVELQRLGDRILFLGPLPPESIPAFLMHSEACLTTPRDYISGGFPTKLGEYLASGVVVVCTGAGEVPRYLTHREDALIAPPGDLEAIADCVMTALRQRDTAQRIGVAGKNLAGRVFNATTYAVSLKSFLFEK